MPCPRAAVDSDGDRFRDVAGKDRLEARMAAAGERQRRGDARQRREAIEETVLGPEHDRGPHDRRRRVRRQHLLLALSLRARIVRGRVRVGADGRDVDHSGADGACGARHRARAFGLDGVEALPAAFEQNADQVDHHVGIAHHRRDRLRVAHVGLHGMDLADAAKRLQMPAELRPAHRHADAVVPVGQRAHHVAADEA